MKTIYSIFCFFLLFSKIIYSNQESFYSYSFDENIYNLNQNNYLDLLSNGLWLVEFYASWCNHCQELSPEWKKLAQLTKNVMGVAATNMEEEGRFFSNTGIELYPTIRLYFDGDIIGTYNNPTDKNSLSIFNWAIQTYQSYIIKTKNVKEEIDYVNNMENNGLYDHNEADNVIRLFGTTFNDQIKDGVWIVNYYAPWCGHCKLFKEEWVRLALMTKGNYNIAAFNMQDDSQGVNFFIEAYPTINLFYNGKLLSTYKGNRNVDDLLSFIMTEVENHILTSISTSDMELADDEADLEKKDKVQETEKEKVKVDADADKEEVAKSDSVEIEKNKYKLIEITDENYSSFLLENKKNTWLVLFVTDVCGLCEIEEEILKKLSISSNITEPFNAGLVNIDANPELYKKYSEEIKPYYKFFHKGMLKKTNFGFNSLENAERTLSLYFKEVSKVYDVIELKEEKHFNNIRYKLGISVLVFMPISEDEDIKNCEEINDSTERTYYEEFYDIIQFSKEGTNIQYYWVKAHKFPKLQMKFSLYSFPIVVALNYEKKVFAVMKGKEFNSDNVHQFISDFSENKQKGKSKNFDNIDFK